MPNSYRIRTQVGVDKQVTVKIDQDFDLLEILSLKITQSEIYTRACSDYGVIVGRVIVNDGYGIPNARVSVFIPLSDTDQQDPIISTLYPYRTLSDTNEEGYRYNLLPYIQSYDNHTPTGTFPDRQDVLLNKSLVEVYDKYYKFTARTNSSGDFMIFGVPVGTHTLFLDLDLSDIGEFSLTPQDMVRLGLASEGQLNGLKFRASSNLYSLPQIVSTRSSVDVAPLWGDPQICQLSITRNDFDLAELGISLQPSAIFMGSIISTSDKYAMKKFNFSRDLCKVRIKTGELCRLVTGPGEIVAIRQTILNDSLGRPILEQYQLDSAGKVIDDNGTWLVDLPMNMDFVFTDEFGNQVLSNDPSVGVPTTAKYRFKIKWEQPTKQNNEIQRGYFLVPNIKEWGWTTNINDDPNKHIQVSTGSAGAALEIPKYPNEYSSLIANYAFSLDWNDYGDPNDFNIATQQINEAISCEDRFFKFYYNKVYTVSQFIDQYRGGRAARKINSIKNVLDDACEDTVNPFPVNDAQFQGDFLYLLFSIFLRILTPVILVLLIIQHILAFVLYLLRPIIYFLALFIGFLVYGICKITNLRVIRKLTGKPKKDCGDPNTIKKRAEEFADLYKKFTDVPLPNLTYPDCEMCNCQVESAGYEKFDPYEAQVKDILSQTNTSLLSDWNSSDFYENTSDFISDTEDEHTIDWWTTGSWDTLITSVMSGTPIKYKGNNAFKDRITVVDGEQIAMQGENFADNPVSVLRKRFYYSTSLTMSERLNLFNTKSKYFNGVAFGPPVGGDPMDVGTANFGSSTNQGVNQIKVKFNVTANTGPNQFHLDNIFIMSCDDGTKFDFDTGSLVYFNDPSKSKDINAFSAETTILTASTGTILSINQISGQTIIGSNVFTGVSTNTNITVKWANPDNQSSINQTSYTINVIKKDNDWHKWPVDMEYFQVITAMTYSQYETFCDSAAHPNTLNKRFLNNRMSIYKNSQGVGYGGGQTYRPYVWSDYDNPDNPYICWAINKGDSLSSLYGRFLTKTNPLLASPLGKKQVIVFMVRGVDPYSTRNLNEYDLSRLFGYDWGNVVIKGNYKLNIPIQPGFKIPKHDEINANTAISSYGTIGSIPGYLFHDTYHYLPGNDYSGFTSNLTSYYSSLDSTTVNGVFPIQDTTFMSNDGDLRVKGVPLNRITNTTTGDIQFPTSKQPSGGSIWYNMMTVDMTKQYLSSCVQSTTNSTDSSRCNTDFECFEADGLWVPQDNYYINNNRGYYRNEAIEGGSSLVLHVNIEQSTNNNNYSTLICKQCSLFPLPDEWYYERKSMTNPEGWYFSPSYDKYTTLTTFLNTNNVEKRRIVLRTDRLPTSTNTVENGCYSYTATTNGAPPGPPDVGSGQGVATNTFTIGNGIWIPVPGSPNPSGWFNYTANSLIIFTISLDIQFTSWITNVSDFLLYVEGPTAVYGHLGINNSAGTFQINLTETYFNTNNQPKLSLSVSYRDTSFNILGGYWSAYNVTTNSYLWQVEISTTTLAASSIEQFNYVGFVGLQNVIIDPNINPGNITVEQKCGNSYVLHQNPNFAIYISNDAGALTTIPPISLGINDSFGEIASGETVQQFANVIDTLNECDKMLPLTCYYTESYPNGLDVLTARTDYDSGNVDWAGTCTTFTALGKTRPIFKVGGGCYLLVTRPILTIPLDIKLLLEWKSRLDLTFGACRNVFGHLFTNNWINGVLYAYSFKNDILFTSPFSPSGGNQPVSTYCYDTLYFHPTTQNFYYRSAPFNPTRNVFVGKPGRVAIGSQENYINNPTTITDLGPRASYLNKLVLNNVFNGYYLDDVTPSSFRETSDILNIFILSRLVNSNFWNQLFGSNGAGIFGLFSRVPRTLGPNVKQKNFVDGDFAQLISINSEIGVAGFDSDNTSDGQNPVIIQIGVNAKATIIGLYFDADLQTRDFVTPHRQIFNSNTTIGNPTAFDYIPINTQIVPYYGWKINNNTARKTIFGTQQNDWNTSRVKGYWYQKQDRVDLYQLPLLTTGFPSKFNYMQSFNSSSIYTRYYRGFIYVADVNLTPPPIFQVSNDPGDIWNPLTGGTPNTLPNVFQVGAPFHFYFGLIKGSTAYDRFRMKWIEGEVVT